MKDVRNIHKAEIAFAVFILAVYALSCGSVGRRRDGDVKPQRPPVEEHFTAIDLPEDSFRVPERVPDDASGRISSGGIDWHTLDSLKQMDPTVDSVTAVYRVQLFASQYFTDAGFEKEIAEDTFNEPVYLLYDVPYYKVLMGNCTSREVGERLLSKARSLGYDNGWLVQFPPDSLYYMTILPEKATDAADTTAAKPEINR
ncbi:MAG: SPOR domain-containing protein [Candidatus Zixiibacteriota bacterium]